MFDFIDKELKLNIVTPLNLPFELIKKFENSLISTLYYGNEGNYDCTKKFIENLNEETNKIFIIYHKILKKFVKVKLEFVSYCSDYDQLLIDTNFKKVIRNFFV
jgi:predicted phosphoadenosine phosphosulfate sulfurtransferase